MLTQTIHIQGLRDSFKGAGEFDAASFLLNFTDFRVMNMIQAPLGRQLLVAPIETEVSTRLVVY